MLAVGLCACQPGAFDDLARGIGADADDRDPTLNDGGGRLDAAGSSDADPGEQTPALDSGAADASADGDLPDSGSIDDAAVCVDMSQQPLCAVCPAGFDDCDGDLTRAPEGNGCETDLRSDHLYS